MSSERISAKRAVLRQRIVEVALDAFSDRGFEATTTSDIADTLQMTGPALYHYFHTKEELLYACMDFILGKLHQQIAEAADSSGSVVKRMAQVARAQLRMELKTIGAAPLVNAHLYGPRYLTDVLSVERREALRLRQRALVQIYRDLINEGVASGHFVVEDVRVAAFNVLALVQYASVWYRPRKGQRMSDLIESQIASVMRLLGAYEVLPVAKPAAARKGQS